MAWKAAPRTSFQGWRVGGRERAVQGAGGSLLRSTAFFDGAGATAPMAVLAAWSVLGLAATWLAGRRERSPGPLSAPDTSPVAVP